MSADPAELRQLFHTLNNQLGIILSHAELIEAKAQDERQKARASQVVHRDSRGADHRAADQTGGGGSERESVQALLASLLLLSF